MNRRAHLLGIVLAVTFVGSTATGCQEEVPPLVGELLLLDHSNSGRTDKFDIDRSSLSITQQVLEGMQPGDGLWVMGFSTDPTEEACRPLVYRLPKMGQSSDVDQIRAGNAARLTSELPAYMACLSSETFGTGNANGTEFFSALVTAARAADASLGSRVLRMRYIGDACSTEPARICAPEFLADPDAATRLLDALDPALKPTDLLAGRTLIVTTTPRTNPLTVVQEQRLHEIYTTYASAVDMTVVFE